MDQQLNMHQMERFDLIFDSDLFQEETLDIIVPDSFADIYRIIDTDGQIRLTGKNIHDGTIIVNGMLDAWILYEPEERRGVCRMEAKVPFTIRQDIQTAKSECVCVAVPTIRGLDCRMLNPRKILLRADLGANIQLYKPNQMQVCTGIVDKESSGIQQLKKETTAFLIQEILEKEFSVFDELRLQNGPSGYGDVISAGVKATCSQAKVIGNKLIIKGEARVAVRYLVEENVYCSTSVIPFSQIMDANELSEDADCIVDMCVTAVNCTAGGEDGRTADISVELLAQAVLRDKCNIVVLQDAYSTTHHLKTELKEYELPRLIEHASCTKNVSEVLGCPNKVRNVIDSSVCCVQVRQSKEYNDLCLEGQLAIRVMYMDDSDQLHCLSQTMNVTGKLENQNHMVCNLRCICPSEVYASVAADGVEVRFDIEFQWLMVCEQHIKAIASAKREDPEDTPVQTRSSVVLRMTTPDETLWQIAKQYQTTEQAICLANEISEGELPVGHMLLIPRCQ